jgi:hypothetical protein
MVKNLKTGSPQDGELWKIVITKCWKFGWWYWNKIGDIYLAYFDEDDGVWHTNDWQSVIQFDDALPVERIDEIIMTADDVRYVRVDIAKEYCVQ